MAAALRCGRRRVTTATGGPGALRRTRRAPVLCPERLDWHRLVNRFGPHWRVLLTHLILFGYIYPSERQRLPREVIHELLHRLARELTAPVSADQPCLGPLLSRIQYRPDIEKMGFKDARLTPDSKMSPEQAVDWTDAGEIEEPKY